MNFADTFKQFVERVLPHCASTGHVFTTYSGMQVPGTASLDPVAHHCGAELAPRKVYKQGAERHFVQFAETDYAPLANVCLLDPHNPDIRESLPFLLQRQQRW